MYRHILHYPEVSYILSDSTYRLLKNYMQNNMAHVFSTYYLNSSWINGMDSMNAYFLFSIVALNIYTLSYSYFLATTVNIHDFLYFYEHLLIHFYYFKYKIKMYW